MRPIDTCKNAAAMGFVSFAALNTVDWTTRFLFVDEAFTIIISNLAIQCANKDGRVQAIWEVPHVCLLEGEMMIVNLTGHFGQHKTVLKALGCTDVHVSLVGFAYILRDNSIPAANCNQISLKTVNGNTKLTRAERVIIAG